MGKFEVPWLFHDPNRFLYFPRLLQAFQNSNSTTFRAFPWLRETCSTQGIFAPHMIQLNSMYVDKEKSVWINGMSLLTLYQVSEY